MAIEKQPAIKSYFFGKGYRDLGNTIADSWKMNGQSAKKYWTKSLDRWEEGGFKLFLAVAMAFAALSVWIFGTIFFSLFSVVHIIILGTFFLTIYVSFTVVWLVDRGYRVWHRIFTACPYCHHKSDLPYYICPKCNAKHSRLIPSSYGIMKRVCRCGQKLPTNFFNGRSSLEPICPSCSRAIGKDFGTVPPICIPLIGGPSVGKTCFLIASVREFMEKFAPQQGWNVRFPDQGDDEMHYKKLSSNFESGIEPEKTGELTPRAFNFFVSDPRWKMEKLIYFYDSAGEAFRSSSDLSKHSFYEYLHGFILIIDPFSIRELCDEYEDELKHNQAIKPSEAILDDTFDTMLNHLMQNYRLKIDQQITKPCAVIINKVDTFDLADKIGETAAQRFMRRDSTVVTLEDAVDKLCRQVLRDEWGLGNFIRKLDSQFKTYRFFTCSALGRSPDQSYKPFRPYGVIEPMMWLLGQADKDLKR
ncbi:MAG: hypothetical protein P9M15_04530 [Candidatus Electryoneaceae bacterium]|nr:hypothetical protein [Candidatus Electryoneaceae bacterium]